MFVTKKAIDRRTFLRGAGATIALPLLDSMVPAFAADAVAAPPRLGFVYVGNGIVHANWTPQSQGRDFELTPNLRPLAGVRDYLNVLTNLAHREADTWGAGAVDRPRSSASRSDAGSAEDGGQPGVACTVVGRAVRNAARELGADAELPAVEVRLAAPVAGRCEVG